MINLNNYNEILNQVVDEIENNLINEIDYKKLAKIAGTTDYTLQKIFSFLTGMTITEYIRKRRLSIAAEDLMKSNEKVIDIAIKYQYDSPISFSRAFKKMHNIAPSQIKQEKIHLKAFPRLTFNIENEYERELEYRIVELQEQVFYGKDTGKIENTNKWAIANLWKEVKKDGTLQNIIQSAKSEELYYAACEYYYSDSARETNNYREYMDYYILGKTKMANSKKIVIPKSTWAMFKINSKEQKEILETMHQIYYKWLPSSKYNVILPYPNLEIYYDNYCEYCIPIK